MRPLFSESGVADVRPTMVASSRLMGVVLRLGRLAPILLVLAMPQCKPPRAGPVASEGGEGGGANAGEAGTSSAGVAGGVAGQPATAGDGADTGEGGAGAGPEAGPGGAETEPEGGAGTAGAEPAGGSGAAAGEAGGVAGAAGAAGSGCGPITGQCHQYCTTRIGASSCADYVGDLEACECECEQVLRADPTCAVLFDDLVVCGGTTPEMFCVGYEVAVIVGCEYERNDFVTCLADSQGGSATCTPDDPSCLLLCSALAAPDCPTTMPIDECTCWCQESMSTACRDRVEVVVDCTGGLMTFACDDQGLPTLTGTACVSDWETLEATCF